MKDRGELYPMRPDAPEYDGDPETGEPWPEGFWDNAVLERPRTRSVHLRIDGDVFDHFVEETGGKGHLTRMQAVLRAYVAAKRKAP